MTKFLSEFILRGFAMPEFVGGTGEGNKITKVWVEGITNQGNADAGAEIWRGAAARIVCEQEAEASVGQAASKKNVGVVSDVVAIVVIVAAGPFRDFDDDGSVFSSCSFQAILAWCAAARSKFFTGFTVPQYLLGPKRRSICKDEGLCVPRICGANVPCVRSVGAQLPWEVNREHFVPDVTD